MTRRPRAVLFDLDDTLVEEEPARDAALIATARSAGRADLDPAELSTTVRRVARELWWAHPLHDFAYGIGVASWEALWARFEGDGAELATLRAWAPEYRLEAWHGALAELGVDDRALAGTLAERFPVERRRIHRRYADAEPVLRALREDGRFRLGLLTNGLSCLQREKLRGAGLGRWFDAVVARYSAMINGFDVWAMTKLDVLDKMETIKICVAYDCDGERYDTVPGNVRLLQRCTPIYEEMPGWQTPTTEVTRFEDLPQAAKDYVNRLVELTGVPLGILSVGPRRRSTLRVGM